MALSTRPYTTLCRLHNSKEVLVPVDNQLLSHDLLENTFEGIYMTDSERKIISWNKGAERITGYSADEVVGHYCFENILNHIDFSGNHLCFDGCPMHLTIADGGMREADVLLHHKSGHRVPVTVRTIPVRNEDGEIAGAVEFFIENRDTARMNRALEEYRSIAMTDGLTEIANRRYIETFLEAKHREFTVFDVPIGILFMDIDDFKYVNDTYGHVFGDEVLKMVAHTLAESARGTDLVGRFGGEEFVIILAGVTEETLIDRAEHMRILIENSYIEYGGDKISATISTGATMMLEDETITDFVKRADSLMYQSKRAGKNIVTIG